MFEGNFHEVINPANWTADETGTVAAGLLGILAWAGVPFRGFRTAPTGAFFYAVVIALLARAEFQGGQDTTGYTLLVGESLPFLIQTWLGTVTEKGKKRLGREKTTLRLEGSIHRPNLYP